MLNISYREIQYKAKAESFMSDFLFPLPKMTVMKSLMILWRMVWSILVSVNIFAVAWLEWMEVPKFPR